MAQSLPHVLPPHKGTSGAKSVLPEIPPPGPALANFIRDGRAAGRDVWRVYSTLFVPRLTLVTIRERHGGEPVVFRPLVADRDRRPYFRPRVLTWLETEHVDAWRALQHDDRAELDCLAAAALRDISGYSEEEIAETLMCSGRHARRLVSRGRKLWPHLCGWPWVAWSKGAKPAHSREHGPDPEIAAILQTWATGRATLPVT